MSRPDELERVVRTVVDFGFQIRRDLGPGLLESAYEALLAAALAHAGLGVRRQVPVKMEYRALS